MTPKVLVFEDKSGISEGYLGIWQNLLYKAGLGKDNAVVERRSLYHSFNTHDVLEWRKPRKQPGFNTRESNQRAIRLWLSDVISTHKPDLVICMDPALLFLCNPEWEQATIDKLRGGVYVLAGIPWVISMPVTAYYSKAKPKDIAKLNDGFLDKGEFEDFQREGVTIDAESDSEDEIDPNEAKMIYDRDSDDDRHIARLMSQWHEPIVVPYGRIVLSFDLSKAGRILRRIKDA